LEKYITRHNEVQWKSIWQRIQGIMRDIQEKFGLVLLHVTRTVLGDFYVYNFFLVANEKHAAPTFH